ncbi:helix-turn-helix domain-containing protein [Candidatus Bodocaedibacter vickermanii]|uniref:Putative Fis-like DNA-binding protein n=1 Tax=Candidatus Bodocaedibacter vickermanii TaxID=2741701 RepID=A0A7L9RSR6_9PROT|nr:Nitrogen assimilation regulatory protein [Candidatus Paracaedibacteraceae bacterium 'Lake Konstanz']
MTAKPSETLSLSTLVSQRLEAFFESQLHSLPVNLYDVIIEQVEHPLIVQTLKITQGNQIKAAEILGINRNTIRKKIKLFNIDPSIYK